MLFSKDILIQFVKQRNLNIILYGQDLSIFDTFTYEKKTSYSIDYKQSKDIYYIPTITSKKSMIVELIDDLSKSPNFYSEKIQKKVIFLLNLQNINNTDLQKIKTIVELRYETSCFIMHFKNYSDIDFNVKQRFIIFHLPTVDIVDDTIDITYKKIIKLIRKPLTKKTIDQIREICYMYYMNHTTSVDLQKYIIYRLKDQLVLPNEIRYRIIKDIVELNKMYRYSYRKPIFLEAIIYCLCKHLEHYAFHL